MRFAPLVPKPKPNANGTRKLRRTPGEPSSYRPAPVIGASLLEHPLGELPNARALDDTPLEREQPWQPGRSSGLPGSALWRDQLRQWTGRAAASTQLLESHSMLRPREPKLITRTRIALNRQSRHELPTGVMRSLELGETEDPLEREADELTDQVMRKPSVAAGDDERHLPPAGILPKLEVGAANDPLEREADAIADQVMRMPAPVGDAAFSGVASLPGGPGFVAQRKCASCEDDDLVQRACSSCEAEDELRRACASCEAEDEQIQRACASCEAEDEELRREPAAGQRGGATSDGFSTKVRARVGSGGRPLPDPARAFLEPRLGVELGGVRVHADAAAGTLARRINARAFTLGQDIFFARGEWRPFSHGGMRLLAHEVAHTLQRTGVEPAVRRPTVRRVPEDEVAQTPTKQRTIEAMGDDYLGAHPELVAKVESLIDDLHHHLENAAFILDNTSIPTDIKKAAQTHVRTFRTIWRTAVKQKLFDSAVMSQWIDTGIRALRALNRALTEAQKNAEFGQTAKYLVRDTKQLQSRAYRLKRHDFFRRGEQWVEDHAETQEAEARESQRKEREDQIEKGLDEIARSTSYAWLGKSDAEIEGEILEAQINAQFATNPVHKKVYEAHIAGLRQIQDERAMVGTFGADEEYEWVLRRGGNDPLATADALVHIVLGSKTPNVIILDRVLSYHYDKSHEFKSTLVMSVVRRWLEPDRTWWDMAAGYAAQDPNITFSVPLVSEFASDVLIRESDGDPIVLANRSLWYIRNNHPSAEALLWKVRSKASYANGDLDEDFDRKFVLEVVSKWAEPSAEFLELQARYIGGEGADAMRVENALHAALGEEGGLLDETPVGGLAAAFGNDTSAIAPEDLDDYLRSLPEEERRELAKAVIARFSSNKRLRTLASSPDTRRALATLGQSLGNLTGAQHGAVWATGLDPTGRLEEWAMLETDQKFEQQFLLKIVKAMAETEKHRHVLPGVDGSWGREVNVTTKVDGTISVFLNGSLQQFEEDRPYFQSHPLQTNIFDIPPERNVVLVYPGDRSVRVPAFWLVRLSELSAQQAVKTGVVVASLVVGVEDVAIVGVVKAAKGINKARTALTKGERVLDAADDVVGQLDEVSTLERGANATDEVGGASRLEIDVSSSRPSRSRSDQQLDDVIRSTGQTDNSLLAARAVDDELEYILRHPDLIEGTPPNRSFQIGEHTWIESPDGHWCRHSKPPSLCVRDISEALTQARSNLADPAHITNARRPKEPDEAYKKRLEENKDHLEQQYLETGDEGYLDKLEDLQRHQDNLALSELRMTDKDTINWQDAPASLRGYYKKMPGTIPTPLNETTLSRKQLEYLKDAWKGPASKGTPPYDKYWKLVDTEIGQRNLIKDAKLYKNWSTDKITKDIVENRPERVYIDTREQADEVFHILDQLKQQGDLIERPLDPRFGRFEGDPRRPGDLPFRGPERHIGAPGPGHAHYNVGLAEPRPALYSDTGSSSKAVSYELHIHFPDPDLPSPF